MKREANSFSYKDLKFNDDIDMWAENDRLIFTSGNSHIELSRSEARAIFGDGLSLIRLIEKDK